MAEPTEGGQPGTMTPENAQVIIGLFRAGHPGAAAEIGHFVDGIIHGLGDDVPDPDRAGSSGAAVSPQAAQAAVEFVMAAMLMASR